MLTLVDNQEALLHVAAVDAAGKPAPLPTGLTWTAADPAILSLTPAADGSTCLVAAAGLGTSAVNVAAGSLSGSLAVTVVAGAAVGLNVTADAPTVIPPPATTSTTAAATSTVATA